MDKCPCFGFSKGRKRESEKKTKNKDSQDDGKTTTAESQNEAPTEEHDMSIKPPTFTFRELKTATNNFSRKSIIGKGGFGSVFKGKLINGQMVAVKQLDRLGEQGEREFLAETLMLSLLDHPNLVKMIGFCGEGSQRLIVYEYMPLGSLDNHLFDLAPGKEPLDWDTRMKIAAGTARGMDFLHNSNPPVIFRDFKPSNILLNQEFEAKISDFGVAKFGPKGDKSHVTTRVIGTRGYCAPEYAGTGQLTTGNDIFSYGIVLLNLITGKRAICEVNGRKKHIRDWVLSLMNDHNNVTILADPLLNMNFPEHSLARALHVASTCIEWDPESRPSSGDLVNLMEVLESEKYNNQNKDTSKDKEQKQASWAEIPLSPIRTASVLDTDVDRDKAVAEARILGETWREIKQHDANR